MVKDKEMDFEKTKSEKVNEYNKLSNRIAQIENEKQSILAEMLRLEGEIRLLNQLIAPKKEDKNV
jgi:hypothetical protein